MIEITCLGGGREIGANSYYINWEGTKILLDCGMNPKKFGYKRIPRFEILDNDIDMVYISHSHLDHVGSLPILYDTHKISKIVTEKSNVPVMEIMLYDSAKILSNYDTGNAEFYNSYFKLNKLRNLLANTCGCKTNITYKLNESISYKLFKAGHILGATGICITDKKGRSLVYTGDFTVCEGLLSGKIDLSSISSPTILIIESTNGMSEYREKDREKQEKILIDEINKALLNNGRVLLPSFALGKTQELINLLKRRFEELLTCPEIVVVGMGNKLTPLYEDEYSIEISTSNRRIGKEIPENSIVIATNGMMYENTPSHTFAKSILNDEDSIIAFTGYLDPDSFGYRLLNAEQNGKIDDLLEKKARVINVSLSLHPSSEAVSDVIETLNPSNVVIVHGEEKSTSKIAENVKKKNVFIPENGEKLILEKNILTRRSDVKNYIVTVGTSLKENYLKQFNEQNKKNQEPKERIEVNENLLMEFIKAVKENAASAETNSISKLKQNIKGANVHFISSDSDDCLMCSNVLEKWVEKEHEAKAEIVHISKLTRDPVDFEKRGIINFIREVSRIIVDSNRNVEIIATGGYKAEIAYATVLGLIFDLPVYYIFDDFKTMINLPGMPVKLDMTLYDLNYETIEKIKATPKIEEAKELINNELISDDFKLLFVKDKHLNRYVDSPIGKIYFEYYKSGFWKRDLNVNIIRSTGTHHTLWGPNISSFTDIKDDAIVTILKRIYNNSRTLIKDMILDEMKKGKKQVESHLEFEKKIGETGLSYWIITSQGKQRLNIYTKPNTNETVFKILGKKIYE